MSCHVSSPSLTKQEMFESGEILTWCGSAKVLFFFFQSAVFVLPPSAAVTFDPSLQLQLTHTHRAFSVWIFGPHLLVKTWVPPARSLSHSLTQFPKPGPSFSRQLLWPLRLSSASLFLWPEYSPYLQCIPYPQLTLGCKTQVCWSAQTLCLSLSQLPWTIWIFLSECAECLWTPLRDYLRGV